MDNQILAHTKYNCMYYIVFIPKYRRKVMYGKIGKEAGEILSTGQVWQTLPGKRILCRNDWAGERGDDQKVHRRTGRMQQDRRMKGLF